jgi:hypothetical protein
VTATTGTLDRTSARSKPSRGRGLALGATAVVTVGFVGAYTSTIGAQTTSDPIRTEIVSVDGDGAPQNLPDTVVPAISDTGGVVVYEIADGDTTVDPAASASSLERRRVWIHDRVGGTGRAVAEGGSVAPGVSGDGCVVAYSVVTATATATNATLTSVDRCAAPIESPLPIGAVLDTVALEPDVAIAPPSLSFDGSTIVWSTGSEIRRYARPPAGGAHERSHTFDTVTGGSSDVVTGIHTDVSADGNTVVFVAGPGTTPFEPTPANVYAWTLALPQLDPELLSAMPSGDPAAADSTSPTITADGSFVVFESNSLELPVVGSESVIAPFVVGVDLAARTGRVLVDDADRPAVSADGQHVVYRRGDAVRVLSSADTATTDHEIAELADARPSGAISISQFGRWIVFAGPLEPPAAPTDASGESPDLAEPALAVWAVDRASSSPDVVDTTATTTTPTRPPSPTTPPAPTAPPTLTVPDVESQPTVPATTLAPTAIVPPPPTVTGRFPSVGLPPPRTVRTSSSAPRVASGAEDGVTAFATPVTFEPTVVDAGRRTQPVILTNAGSRTLDVVGASIDVAGAFAVVGDTCSGAPLAPGSSCSIEVQFAPIAVGPASAFVTFRLSDGSLVTGELSGEGVPEPTLDLVPAVAGSGQTVTVFGAGFPPGTTVELSRPGSSTSSRSPSRSMERSPT